MNQRVEFGGQRGVHHCESGSEKIMLLSKVKAGFSLRKITLGRIILASVEWDSPGVKYLRSNA